MAEQFEANGGDSLRDAVDKMAGRQTTMQSTLNDRGPQIAGLYGGQERIVNKVDALTATVDTHTVELATLSAHLTAQDASAAKVAAELDADTRFDAAIDERAAIETHLTAQDTNQKENT